MKRNSSRIIGFCIVALLAAVVIIQFFPNVIPPSLRFITTAADNQVGNDVGDLIERDVDLASELKKEGKGLTKLYSTGLPAAVYLELLLSGSTPPGSGVVDRLKILLETAGVGKPVDVTIKPSDGYPWAPVKFVYP